MVRRFEVTFADVDKTRETAIHLDYMMLDKIVNVVNYYTEYHPRTRSKKYCFDCNNFALVDDWFTRHKGYTMLVEILDNQPVTSK